MLSAIVELIIALLDQLPQFSQIDLRIIPADFWEVSSRHLEIQDLKAQQNMASAAWWMLALAVLQAIAGILGVYFIIETCSLTRESVSASAASAKASLDGLNLMKENAELELRPWLYYQILDYEFPFTKTTLADGKLAYEFTVRVVIKNYGKSPALNVGFIADFAVPGRPNLRFDSVEKYRPDLNEKPNGEAVFPGQETKTSLYILLLAEDVPETPFFHPTIRTRLWYMFPSKGSWHVTSQDYGIVDVIDGMAMSIKTTVDGWENKTYRISTTQVVSAT